MENFGFCFSIIRLIRISHTEKYEKKVSLYYYEVLLPYGDLAACETPDFLIKKTPQTPDDTQAR